MNEDIKLLKELGERISGRGEPIGIDAADIQMIDILAKYILETCKLRDRIAHLEYSLSEPNKKKPRYDALEVYSNSAAKLAESLNLNSNIDKKLMLICTVLQVLIIELRNLK